jgi:hypothetical protein
VDWGCKARLGKKTARPSAARKTFPRKNIHTEISPLRFASVEMTKGRAVLPESVVAEQKPKAYDSFVENKATSRNSQVS